jgi:hydrogenase maturation factor HypF (carbamoyltransferase family)
MVDEIFDRHYQEGRSELNASIGNAFGRFVDAVSNAFKVLNRIEYQAPWAIKAKRVRYN